MGSTAGLQIRRPVPCRQPIRAKADGIRVPISALVPSSDRTSGSRQPLKCTGATEAVKRSMPVLGERDLEFWEENGYVVLPGAVPKPQLAALVAVIWDFLEMDPDNPDDWYKWTPYDRNDPRTPISEAGMVSMYQHQAMWDNRQISAGVSGLHADPWAASGSGSRSTGST